MPAGRLKQHAARRGPDFRARPSNNPGNAGGPAGVGHDQRLWVEEAVDPVQGGEALANTAWSVITPGGDVIKESIGAFPKVVLSEGEYRAIAKNEGKVFERPFNVVNGVDGEVEVVAR